MSDLNFRGSFCLVRSLVFPCYLHAVLCFAPVVGEEDVEGGQRVAPVHLTESRGDINVIGGY